MTKTHWEKVYASKPSDRLGWYEAHLRTSLAWIAELGLTGNAPIIDVGGGASTLVDDLLDARHCAVTVLDISGPALASSRSRLGSRADLVVWLEDDITTVDLPDHYFALWHDRAVFHFLTTPELRAAYRENLARALKPGGDVLIATFAPEAPPTCSGLPVQRYSPEQLQDALGARLLLRRHKKELHITPGGVEQMYLYCHFRSTT